MNARQVSVVVAVIVILAGLLYYESRRANAPETEAFAPAQSADESVAVDDDTPIEPPAALTEAPAAEQTPTQDTSAGAQEASEASDGEAMEPETAAEADMESPDMAETEPSEPALAELEAEPQPESAPAMVEDEAAAEPESGQAADTSEAATEPEHEPPSAPAQTEVAAATPEPEGPALARQTPAIEPGEEPAMADEAQLSDSAETDVAVIEESAGAEAAMVEPPEEAAPQPEAEALAEGEQAAGDDSAVAATEPGPAAEAEGTMVTAEQEPMAGDDATAMAEPAAPAEDDSAAAAVEPGVAAEDETTVAMAQPEPAADDDGATATAESESMAEGLGESETPAAIAPEPSETETELAAAESPAAAATEAADAGLATDDAMADAPATDGASDEVEIVVSEATAEPSDGDAAVTDIGVIPTFDVVRVEPSGDAVVAGLAGRESTVEIMSGPTVVAVAEANERGEWALALDQPLPPGTHDLAIRTTSPDESVVLLSDQRVAVSVPEAASEEALVVLNSPDSASRVIQMPETAPEQEVALADKSPPTAPEAQPDESAADVAVVPDGDDGTAQASSAGAEEPSADDTTTAEAPAVAAETAPAASEPEITAEVPSEPEALETVAPEVGVAAVEADTAGNLFVAGTAEAAGPVRVYVDDEFVGEAEPSETGTWLVEVRREMAEGTYSVRADQVEKDSGTVIARAEVPFEREIEVATLKPMAATTDDRSGTEVSAEIPALETVIIKRGDNLWRIARRLYGRGIRYSTIYQANKDQIRNPHWIYPGQVFMLPAGDTNWDN